MASAREATRRIQIGESGTASGRNQREADLLQEKPGSGLCGKGLSPNSRSGRQSIRASTDLCRFLVEAAGQAGHGIAILQDNDAKEGAIAFVNPDFPGLLGYSRNALLGKTIRDIISPKDVPVVAERYMQRQKGQHVPPCYEIRAFRRDRVEIGWNPVLAKEQLSSSRSLSTAESRRGATSDNE